MFSLRTVVMDDSDFELSLGSEGDSNDSLDNLPEVGISGTPRKSNPEPEICDEKKQSAHAQKYSASTPTRTNSSERGASSSSLSLKKAPTTTPILVPPPPSLLPSSISPLKREQLLQHQKQLQGAARLATKVKKLSEDIQMKTEKENLLEDFLSKGGIRGVSQELEKKEESMSDFEEEATPGTPGKIFFLKSTSTSNPEPSPLPARPPGKTIFSSPPSLIEELYPPGTEGEGVTSLEKTLLQADNQECIREVICGGWLKTCYDSRPCPLNVWQWLFQIMCCAPDPVLSNAAFRSLVDLQQLAVRRTDSSSSSIHPPTIRDIIEVLVSLGADENLLLSAGGDAMEVGENDDVFEARKLPLINLTYLARYLTACLSVVPESYTIVDVEKLILLLFNVTLDPCVCGETVAIDFTHCIISALNLIPEDSWTKFASDLASEGRSVSVHHHNRLSLALLISGISKRSKQLQKMFCKLCIEETLGLKPVEDGSGQDSMIEIDEGGDSSIPPPGLNSESAFSWSVIEHYAQQSLSSLDFYSMYSVLTMLLLFMHPSNSRWPTIEAKKGFEKLLGSLVHRIRDQNLSHRERTPVKDLLIRMKLEVGSVAIGNVAKQTDLFDLYAA